MKAIFNCLCTIAIFTTTLLPLHMEAETAFHSNFSKDNDGWVGEFADYPVGQEAFFELHWGWVNLPYPLQENEKGIVLSGNNHSDDLVMLVKKQITGLEPNTDYVLTFEVTIESNIPVGQMGVGGSPGEGVYFKVGASTQEPLKVVSNDYYRMNIDIGNQGNSGVNGIVIGDLANPDVDPQNPTFAPKTMTNLETLVAKTDEAGSLWLIVGTDSGYEATSTYYIANITIKAEH